MTTTNLAALILEHASARPDHQALVVPSSWSSSAVEASESLTFGELGQRVGGLRRGLAQMGLRRGDRVVVMFPVSVGLYVLVVALLASGLVPVLIDTKMGKSRVLEALGRAKPRALFSVRALLRHWPWLPALWGLKRVVTDAPTWGCRSLRDVADEVPTDEPIVELPYDSSGLITFTSGTTGRPKGANRTHDILIAQHLALKEHFVAADDEVDMPAFPVVALHNLCSGITTVMPAVDLADPSSVKPAVIVHQIRGHRVTRMTGAPAYMNKVVGHLIETGERLPSVRSVGVGAAPVSPSLCAQVQRAFPDAEALAIYGSTEAEPIASLTMAEVVATPPEGYLVGREAPAATVAIVDLPEAAPTLDAREMAPYEVPLGEVGELVVKGAHVLRHYVDDVAADRETKVPTPSGEVWHRTLDMAKRDAEGRLWLLGRRPDQLEVAGRTVHPFPVEIVIDGLDGVRRSALLGRVGVEGGEIVIEPDGALDDDRLERSVYAVLGRVGLAGLPIVFVAAIPMDARHASKIDRPALRTLLEAR